MFYKKKIFQIDWQIALGPLSAFLFILPTSSFMKTVYDRRRPESIALLGAELPSCSQETVEENPIIKRFSRIQQQHEQSM